LDPRRLTFEIVETEWIAETSHLLNIITEYRRMGFRVALDDFGTGYSGLVRLAVLRPDVIKVDRALIQDCDRSATKLAVVASLIALGAELGVKVVLEGVERSGEVEALKGAGARFMQGFYFARPSYEKLVPEADLDWARPNGLG
jgi:EAL domain-containing protein (putative c-di-GMP-specific phosphodiesterase class I)